MVMTPAGPATGDFIGEYRITAEVGDGTYRAAHVRTSERVVIRVAPYRDPAQASVIASTSRKLGTLDHPGILRVVAHGLLPDRRAWIASEHRDGTALATAIANRLLRVDEVASLIQNVAAVLAYAHEHDVIHGRLRVDSLMLATDGRSPIIVSEWIDVVDETSRSELVPYTAPEAAGMSLVDGRLDVFALGVIAYRVFTGRFPEGPVSYVPGAPPPLAKLMSMLLEPAMDRRPHAEEARHAIATLLGSSGPAKDEQRHEFDDEDPVAVIRADAPATIYADDEPLDAPEIVIEAEEVPAPTLRFGRPKWTPAPTMSPVEAAPARELADTLKRPKP